jgi:hypothetical protein
VLSIDTSPITVLERMGWRPFSGVGKAVFSLLGVKPERKKLEEAKMKEKTSVHILCECEATASLRHTYLGSFFLGPEDIRKLNIGAIWNFAKGTGLL